MDYETFERELGAALKRTDEWELSATKVHHKHTGIHFYFEVSFPGSERRGIRKIFAYGGAEVGTWPAEALEECYRAVRKRESDSAARRVRKHATRYLKSFKGFREADS
jgi:hypothetical protein